MGGIFVFFSSERRRGWLRRRSRARKISLLQARKISKQFWRKDLDNSATRKSIPSAPFVVALLAKSLAYSSTSAVQAYSVSLALTSGTRGTDGAASAPRR